jgi:hypothetical protein
VTNKIEPGVYWYTVESGSLAPRVLYIALENTGYWWDHVVHEWTEWAGHLGSATGEFYLCTEHNYDEIWAKYCAWRLTQ